jgi:hypothetical protein
MTIHDFDFKSGNLILVCNMAIEKALNKKMRLRYFGLMVVVSYNKRGAYIICDLDGMLAHALIAAFRVVLYFACEHLDLPDLKQHINVSVTRLCKLEDSTISDPDYPEIAEELRFYKDDSVGHTLNNNNNNNEEPLRPSVSQ